MKNKILSVAVPCYNSQDYMRKCIDSILVGGEEVEIIIVNDGSTDDTAKIAEEYKRMYPSIVKVVHKVTVMRLIMESQMPQAFISRWLIVMTG